MKASARFLYILSLTVFCVACGGGGGGATSPPPIINESPGGIWRGIDSDGDAVFGLVTETGRFHFIIEKSGNQGSGILSVSNGNEVTANFQLVTGLFGPFFPDGTTLADCTLSGTVIERQTMSVTVNCTTTAGLQDEITVALAYEANYERNSSLATIAGMYNDGNVVTDIASDGTIFAQNPSGCIANGQIRVIDSAFNVYEFEFVFSNCIGQEAFLNGSIYIGLAALNNTVSPERLIVILIGDVGGTLVSGVVIGERI